MDKLHSRLGAGLSGSRWWFAASGHIVNHLLGLIPRKQKPYFGKDIYVGSILDFARGWLFGYSRVF